MQNNISMSTGNHLFSIIFSMVSLLAVSSAGLCKYLPKGIMKYVNRSPGHCLGRRVFVLGMTLAHVIGY